MINVMLGSNTHSEVSAYFYLTCFLELIMFSLFTVEWSINGNYVAVARNNILTILSSKFKERVSLVLPFESLIGDSDVNSAVKGMFDVFYFHL